ncbi:PepSY-associated TM helix domain-containing protein [Robertkochia flava]|uniref:PepSY-associated TM helix domain-containing protein n=1 Tax=Robertkochia flava TaxID=3447986 RepID=UPI001CC95750|nr:PepSY-associated TM helix domain-containing protein [Robertkochia marina]
MANSRQKHARILRDFRKVHRYTGALLFIIFLFIALTGISLGLKKNTGDMILPKTRTGTTSQLTDWLSLAELESKVYRHLDSIGKPEVTLDRVDIRKDKGIAKFIFKEEVLEVQVNGANGKILNTGKRYSDLLEDLHDGSYVDDLFGIPHGIFKIIYTMVSGLALLIFTITGFWLWYGPKYMKRLR